MNGHIRCASVWNSPRSSDGRHVARRVVSNMRFGSAGTTREGQHYNRSWTFVPISRAIAMGALPYSIRTRRIAFHPGNVPEFAEFLAKPNGPYFVMEHEGSIAGCGGYFITGESAVARLVWGMVRRELQRHGLGRFLLLFRLRDRESGRGGTGPARRAAAFGGLLPASGLQAHGRRTGPCRDDDETRSVPIARAHSRHTGRR